MRWREPWRCLTGRRGRPHCAIVSDTLIRTADPLLRGGACLLLALLAALVLRYYGRVGDTPGQSP